jgi:threonine dehydrogenase-like Zn-dependent dehydrogenase
VGVYDVIDVENPQPSTSRESDLFDIAIEATGNPALLDQAIAGCRREGRVVIASFYGTKVAPVRLGERFHRERLTLSSSQVSEVATSRRSRFDFDRRFEVVLEQLANPKLDALFETPTPFAHAERAYARLLDAPDTLRQLTLAY